jgi:hypothetical protein
MKTKKIYIISLHEPLNLFSKSFLFFSISAILVIISESILFFSYDLPLILYSFITFLFYVFSLIGIFFLLLSFLWKEHTSETESYSIIRIKLREKYLLLIILALGIALFSLKELFLYYGVFLFTLFIGMILSFDSSLKEKQSMSQLFFLIFLLGFIGNSSLFLGIFFETYIIYGLGILTLLFIILFRAVYTLLK